jgi:hypothetical protein
MTLAARPSIEGRDALLDLALRAGLPTLCGLDRHGLVSTSIVSRIVMNLISVVM